MTRRLQQALQTVESQKREIDSLRHRPFAHAQSMLNASDDFITAVKANRRSREISDDEKDLMIDALTKMLATKTERLERAEMVSNDCSEELGRLRRQLAQQSQCRRCRRATSAADADDNDGCDVVDGSATSATIESLRRNLAEKVAQLERLTAELDKSKRETIETIERQQRLNDEVMRNSQNDHQREVSRAEQECQRLADRLAEAEQQAAMLADVVKEKELSLTELEDRLADSERRRREAADELAAEIEEGRTRQEECDRLRVEADRCKRELDSEMRRSAGLAEDVRHLRLEQMDKTALRSVETKNALLGEDLERVENKLKQMQAAEDELKAAVEAAERTVGLLRGQLELAGVEISESSARALAAEAKANELQARNDQLARSAGDLENLVRTLTDKTESLSDEAEAERAKRKTAEAKVLSLQDKNSKLLLSSQSLKDRCTELEDEVNELVSSSTSGEDKVAALMEANARLAKDVETYKSEVENLHEELDYVNAELSRSKRDCKEKSSAEERLLAELNELKVELSQLQFDRDNARQTIEQKTAADGHLLAVADSTTAELVEKSAICERSSRTEAVGADCHSVVDSGCEHLMQQQKQKLLNEADAHKRRIDELEEINAALKRQLRAAEIDGERRAAELSASMRTLGAKLEAAERRNRRLTLQQQQQQQQVEAVNGLHVSTEDEEACNGSLEVVDGYQRTDGDGTDERHGKLEDEIRELKRQLEEERSYRLVSLKLR
jgi:chromosome segregation ATPase